MKLNNYICRFNVVKVSSLAVIKVVKAAWHGHVNSLRGNKQANGSAHKTKKPQKKHKGFFNRDWKTWNAERRRVKSNVRQGPVLLVRSVTPDKTQPPHVQNEAR